MLVDISKAFKFLGEEFEFSGVQTLESQNIYGETIDIDPVNVVGYFTSTDEEIIVHGSLNTNAYGKCARCLDDVKVSVTLDFSEVFVRESEVVDFDNEDLFFYQGHNIDLEEMVRVLIISELPMKFICRKESCNTTLSEELNDFNEANKENPFNVLQEFFKNDEEV